MGSNKTISLEKTFLICYQILTTNCSTKCMEISLEKLYWILRLKGITCCRRSVDAWSDLSVSSLYVLRMRYSVHTKSF